MKEYEVKVEMEYTATVEADNEEEAFNEAYDEAIQSEPDACNCSIISEREIEE